MHTVAPKHSPVRRPRYSMRQKYVVKGEPTVLGKVGKAAAPTQTKEQKTQRRTKEMGGVRHELCDVWGL